MKNSNIITPEYKLALQTDVSQNPVGITLETEDDNYGTILKDVPPPTYYRKPNEVSELMIRKSVANENVMIPGINKNNSSNTSFSPPQFVSDLGSPHKDKEEHQIKP